MLHFKFESVFKELQNNTKWNGDDIYDDWLYPSDELISITKNIAICLQKSNSLPDRIYGSTLGAIHFDWVHQNIEIYFDDQDMVFILKGTQEILSFKNMNQDEIVNKIKELTI